MKPHNEAGCGNFRQAVRLNFFFLANRIPNNGVASVNTKFVSTDSSLLNDELSFNKDQWIPTIFTMDFFMHYQLQLLVYFLSLPYFGSIPVYLFRSIRGIGRHFVWVLRCCIPYFLQAATDSQQPIWLAIDTIQRTN